MFTSNTSFLYILTKGWKSQSAYLIATHNSQQQAISTHYMLRAGEPVWYDPVLMDTNVPTTTLQITENGKA